MQLSIIGMNDPNNSPVDRMTSAVQPLRTGTTQVNEVAGHATTPAAKAKIQAMANDLTAMADALYAQLPAIRSGQDFNTKAADPASKQLRTDAGDLGGICWT
jgi:eukaryotic-like serine/threonine-protein kinase